MSQDQLEQDQAPPPRLGPGPIERFAGGFSAPFVLVALLAGGVTGWVTREPEASAQVPASPTTPPGAGDPEEPPPGTQPPGTQPPETDTQPPETQPPGTQAATRASVQALIDAGQLREARQAARAGGFPDLEERAALLLAFAENVVLSSFGQADAALLVTLDDGREVLGVPQGEAGGTLELETWDGEKLALTKPSIQQRKTLRGREKSRALGEALARARAALGGRPSGLSVHRLAFLALRGGDAASGTRLLLEALGTQEGRILVDMFGSGDFALLHRAREALTGGGSGAPPPRPQPPQPATPDPLPVEPDPEPVAPPPRNADPLERDADWRRVEAQYREGLGLYRQAFGDSIQAGAPLVKGALRRFQQAQELLERLLDRYPDEPRVEQRMIELNTLVLDCNKRLGTD